MTDVPESSGDSRTPSSGLQGQAGNVDSPDGLVGERLRRARHVHGLTLSAVASRVGLSHNFLSMVERGLTDISLSRFRRLADFYGIPASELLSHDATAHEPQISSSSAGVMIDRGPGIRYQLLPNAEFGVQVVHIVFEPEAGFTDKLAHVGADIVWVVRGAITLLYGEREFEVLAGHCVSYKGTVLHAFENRSSSEQAELVGVATTPYW